MGRKQGTYSDEEVIAGIQAGGIQRQRFSQWFYDQHTSLVIKGMRKYRLSEEAAADVYTDAVISLFRQVENGRFKGDSTLFTYLFKIYQNKCLNQIRSQQKQGFSWREEFPILPDYARNALEQLIDQEKLDKLEAYIARLGEKCRQILWDTSYFGYTAEEVAERMGYKDANSVYITKHRCLKKLEQLIPSP